MKTISQIVADAAEELTGALHRRHADEARGALEVSPHALKRDLDLFVFDGLGEYEKEFINAMLSKRFLLDAYDRPEAGHVRSLEELFAEDRCIYRTQHPFEFKNAPCRTVEHVVDEKGTLSLGFVGQLEDGARVAVTLGPRQVHGTLLALLETVLATDSAWIADDPVFKEAVSEMFGTVYHAEIEKRAKAMARFWQVPNAVSVQQTLRNLSPK